MYDTRKLAETLNVDSIVRGKLEKHGDQIIISVSLVNASDETQIWGERLVRHQDEVIYLERSIVAAIKESLRLKIADAQSAVFASGGTDIPEAYQRYQRGHFLIQSTSPESIKLGLEELRAAISIDPRFALPYADIADALSQMIFYGVSSSEILIGEARNAAYTAVALAPELPEAQTALATVHQYITFDWRAADEAYEAAVALEPQSPAPFHRYADYLWLTLRFERAREMAQRAIEIDPMDGNAMHAVGITALFDGDFAAAAKAFGEWNHFYPGSRWSYAKHALALSLLGECTAALNQAAEVRRLTRGQMSPFMESWQLWVFSNCGENESYAASRERLVAGLSADPGKTQPAWAYLYAIDNDPEALLDLLRHVVDTRSAGTLFVQLYRLDYMGWPVVETLSKDPRYIDLLSGLDFPPAN